ncbi:hypothetical protein RhiJN_06395 [Ceratobasidium sp. AG-Ba]|nr:hypothetical protein RhiJN_06395 [Ceratobasidium sp. AG-Ba]QRW07310.1 hypothetical protein RhiLY_06309 [Ceratobasidium sp. AG-Ba]
MSSPIRKPSCLKQNVAGLCTESSSRTKQSSNPLAAPGSIGGTSEMLPYAQANVHFPTAKRELVKTRVTHSPSSYDRSPIVVQPNSCALPARGCPGRTYDPTPVSPSGRTIHPSAQFHSSASMSQSPPRIRRPATPCAVPGLIPDEGSSDDSDGLISPPPERSGNSLGYMGAVCDDSDRAMLFAAARSRTNSPPKTKSRRSSREYRASSSAGFDSSDEGCLGGF